MPDISPYEKPERLMSQRVNQLTWGTYHHSLARSRSPRLSTPESRGQRSCWYRRNSSGAAAVPHYKDKTFTNRVLKNDETVQIRVAFVAKYKI